MVVPKDDTNKIELLAQHLYPEARITVLTGAGISAASGVPTFRGSDGLWKNHSFEQLATPEAFRRDPHLVWEWYNWRREIISQCRPNDAHHVLASWSGRWKEFTLITQNVDGLHERAGVENIIRFHGSIWEVLCRESCKSSPPRWRDETVPFPEIPPRCRYCGGLIRPGVVWFGEPIDPEAMNRSIRATECDTFIAVGTSALVYPAAGLASQARRNGAFTVEINLEATSATAAVDLSIHGPAADILRRTEELFHE